ncbi:MAG TPA: hypothetical protein VN428_22880 [Bryobacteraceae bacterium]|nr:hypothetical protein [Bryobacteraceae bacterium]
MKNPVQCIDRLQSAADALENEGADPAGIVAALVKVTVTTARKDRDAAATLDAAAQVLLRAAERAFGQAKKARAEKRRKNLKD